MPKITINKDHNSPLFGLPIMENTDDITDGVPVPTLGADLKRNIDDIHAEEKKAKEKPKHDGPVKQDVK